MPFQQQPFGSYDVEPAVEMRGLGAAPAEVGDAAASLQQRRLMMRSLETSGKGLSGRGASEDGHR